MPLPGDLSEETLLSQAIRVDHAGEYGARRIYEGQLAVLRHSDVGPEIERMYEQELAHLQTFERLLNEKKVRPTALMPLWHVAGYALGAGTALLGTKAAMACTVAVEEVIAGHYGEQARALEATAPELAATAEQFRREELEHHDTGLTHDAQQAPFYDLLSGAIRAGCHAAIWLSKRV